MSLNETAAIEPLNVPGSATLDDAVGFLVNPVTGLRQQLRIEQAPMARLGIMRAILDAYASTGSDQPRARMASLYDYDQHRKPAQRKRENTEAMALLAQIDAGQINPGELTSEQKAVLAKYSGTGGALIGADGKKGSAYEYYTPLPIAESVFEVLKGMGFTGGKMLDPAAGSGVFGAAAPDSVVVDAIELSDTSGRINELVNGGPGYSVTVSPFEAVAAATPDETYDAVITNVPFGEVADRGGNQLKDPRYQNEPLQNYFILRSLEKLRHGGVAAFITPPRCMSGKDGAEKRLRLLSSYMAEFMGAYRLPNSVFGTAGADTMTDVIFFRKYSREVTTRIDELLAQNPQVLADANVLWGEYLDGLYFVGEGRRFVLGEFVPKDPNKYRDVDRVISPASIPEVAKMMQRLPDSRINWELLQTVETEPIVYRDGDTLSQAGQTLQMQDGRWIPIARTEGSAQAAQLLGQLATPYGAFENRISFDSALGLVQHMIDMSQALDIPGWLRELCKQVGAMPAAERSTYWGAAVVGLSVEQVISERARDEQGVNYADEYRALSDAMQTYWQTAKSAASVRGPAVKRALRSITTYYSKKTGFTAFWRGDILAEVKGSGAIDASSGFEGLRYRLKSIHVPLDQAKEVLGADFDPMATDEYCVSGDGKLITPAADYYSGNYGEFLARINAEIASASNEPLKAKLLRQKVLAEARIERVDLGAVEFNLFSPHVTNEEKAEFLRRFVHPSAAVVYDETTGKARPDIQIKGKDLSDRDKLLNRIGDYLKHGTITLGTAQLGMNKDEALRELAMMVRQANEQFNAWARSNRTIIDRLQAIADDPARLRFESVEDEAPLMLKGLNPGIVPHGYQNSFARQQGREFGKGNAFDVGLGKTLTALLSVLYVQSIGVKKKTAFVSPGSVLSKWREEAIKAYANTDDCLYVGLREKKGGGYVVDPEAYDEDLNRIRENRHSKIFMTMEAWERLRMRDETIQAFGAYMRSVDSSFAEVQDKKQDERNKGKAADFISVLGNKSGGAPYIEDLGIDSLVSDEAHAYKNSSEVSEFRGGKYLSLAESSQRGLDMQAKAWFIRGLTQSGDGVLLLTASPLTNSPLEIYSMLALAVGHQRVNDLSLGIQGADQFMQMMCQIDTESDTTMDGIERETNVFTGLKNVAMLRRSMNSVFTIKTAADVGAQIVVPDRSEVSTPITLAPGSIDRLKLYKEAFRYAIDVVSGRDSPRGDQQAFEEVSAYFGEPIELIGHPFNLINKMNLLIMDPELDERATYFSFDKDQAAKVAALVEKFNKAKISETRTRPGPFTAPDAIVSTKTTKEQDGQKKISLKIEVRAEILGDGRIRIDTTDAGTQARWDAMCEAAGVDLDVTIPPKLAALLANVKAERATPRGVDAEGNKSPIVKQVVFCDVLAMHSKIKRVLSKYAGIPLAAIAVITGTVNNKPEQILAVQHGFNAHGLENQYQTVLANEKAEVGIDLQIGTQATHHLTIGWTPDSLQQRNGRAARQGNRTGTVNEYYYNADGTFDCSKREMVNKKASWIGQVMDPNGGNRVSITGGLTSEQIAALIETVGDGDAMRRMQETMAAKEAERRAKTNRERQLVNLDTIIKQRFYVETNGNPKTIAARKVLGLRTLSQQVRTLQERIANARATATSVARNESILAEVQARIDGLTNSINSSVEFTPKGGGRSIDLAQYLQDEGHNYKGPLKDDDLEAKLTSGSYKYVMTVREGSAIHAEWESEIAMAQAMLEQSIKAFEAQSEDAGAISKPVARLVAQGLGTVMQGKPIVQGAFVRSTDGMLAAYKHDPRYPEIYWIRTSGDQGALLASRLNFDKFTVINPGDAAYDSCLTEAAAKEDELFRAGKPILTYSSLIPEVGQRRTTEALQQFNRFTFTLVAPHYPLVVTSSEAERGQTLARIHELQKDVVRGFSEDGQYFTASSDDVMEGNRPDRDYSLASYAYANGLTIDLSELVDSGSYALSKLVIPLLSGREKQAADYFKASLGEAVQNTDDLVFRALKGLHNSAPWLNWEGSGLALGDINRLMVFMDSDFGTAWTKAKAALRQSDEAAEVGAPQDAVQDPNLPVFVSISGETKKWKDQIKACAGAGNYRWDKNAEVWNVRSAGWLELIKRYPTAQAELTMGDATSRVPR